jgi:hypothetical protein
LDARLMTLLCKKITVAKSKEMKTGWSTSRHSQEQTNLAESSERGYD